MVTYEIPYLSIPVSTHILDSKIPTQKFMYTANEEVKIINSAKNLTSYPSTLLGKVEIIDTNGNTVKVLSSSITNTWNAGESKSADFLWNTEKTMTGTYKARVTWSEGDKVISVAESSFDIVEDRSLSSTITVDKQKYSADEEVNITGKVTNLGTNNIEKGLNAKINVKNSEGIVIWSSDNNLTELLPDAQTSLKNSWNTAKNPPGKYIVTMEVYKETEKLTESSTVLEIVAGAKGIEGVSGSIEILQKNIYPSDAVGFKYIVNNTGNIDLSDVTARIRIVDTATEIVLETLTEKINIDVTKSYTKEKSWNHKPLKTGKYMVVFDAILSDGKEIPLGSGYIKVEKPYETTISQV